MRFERSEETDAELRQAFWDGLAEGHLGIPMNPKPLDFAAEGEWSFPADDEVIDAEIVE